MVQELGGQFRCDGLEVEMPSVSHGVRFSPMGRANTHLPN
jgi:hypothetical protein